MKKVIKNREDFVNENYYESSPTMVPGAGVGPGLFPGAAANPEFFSTSDPQNIVEKDVPQIGANGVDRDPDYRPPSQYTHAKGIPPHLGDIVEDINKECKAYGTTGKVFTIHNHKAQYIVANETENYAIGEVVNVPLANLKTIKVHQINQGLYESKSEERKIHKWLKKHGDNSNTQGYEYVFVDDGGMEFDAKIENGVVTLWDGEEETTMDPKSFIKDWMNESENINEAKDFKRDKNKLAIIDRMNTTYELDIEPNLVYNDLVEDGYRKPERLKDDEFEEAVEDLYQENYIRK